MKVILKKSYYEQDQEVETGFIKIPTKDGEVCIDLNHDEVNIWSQNDDKRVAVSAVATEQGEILRIELVKNK